MNLQGLLGLCQEPGTKTISLLILIFFRVYARLHVYYVCRVSVKARRRHYPLTPELELQAVANLPHKRGISMEKGGVDTTH